MSDDEIAASNTDSISVTFASPKDFAAICAIEQHCFSTPWSPDTIKNELFELSWSRTLVAKKDKQTVGYLCFWTVADEFQILKIAVQPEFRNQKIANTLIGYVIALGKEEETSLISLELRQSNHAAKHLYQKTQFQIVGVRPRYYTDTNEDAILMNYQFQPNIL